MDIDKLKKEIEKHASKKVPKFNRGKCKDGCNCIEIAESKNNDEPVKQYPCLG